jgi:hypothetical protein
MKDTETRKNLVAMSSSGNKNKENEHLPMCQKGVYQHEGEEFNSGILLERSDVTYV